MIYKRGRNYAYKFKWSLPRPEGGRETFVIRKAAHTPNARQAREVEEEHRRALRLGQIHPRDTWPLPKAPAVPTFRAFAKTFQEQAKSHTKPGTARFYGISLSRLLTQHTIADADLTDITGELVNRYAQRQLANRKSVASVNADIRTIRRMLNLAEEWALIPRAPRTHELPGARGRERVISYNEEAKYLARASATVRDLAILAVDTGLRPNSELFSLRWSAVVLQDAPEAPHGLVRVRSGKTESAERAVLLTPRAREVLAARKRNAKALYVFPGPGKRGHLETVQHAHAKAVKKAAIDPFPFYCWRHTFGTRCAESGMDRFTLARLMGHSSPRVAERYYIHVTEAHVTSGFGKFLEYQERNLSRVIGEATLATQ